MHGGAAIDERVDVARGSRRPRRSRRTECAAMPAACEDSERRGHTLPGDVRHGQHQPAVAVRAPGRRGRHRPPSKGCSCAWTSKRDSLGNSETRNERWICRASRSSSSIRATCTRSRTRSAFCSETAICAASVESSAHVLGRVLGAGDLLPQQQPSDGLPAPAQRDHQRDAEPVDQQRALLLGERDSGGVGDARSVGSSAGSLTTDRAHAACRSLGNRIPGSAPHRAAPSRGRATR